jgi:hypothetical protein
LENYVDRTWSLDNSGSPQGLSGAAGRKPLKAALARVHQGAMVAQG